jgi:peptidoglycan hydrolase-like protein with peptidoglycan-binding domain
MKTGKVIFFSVLGLAVATTGILVYAKVKSNKKKKLAEADAKAKAQEEMTKSGVATPSANVSTGSSWKDDGFPLTYYSYGEKVKKLQEALNKLGASLDVDGAFGSLTASALKLKGYTDSVNETTYNAILLKANPTTTTTTTTTPATTVSGAIAQRNARLQALAETSYYILSSNKNDLMVKSSPSISASVIAKVKNNTLLGFCTKAEYLAPTVQKMSATYQWIKISYGTSGVVGYVNKSEVVPTAVVSKAQLIAYLNK